MTPKDSEARVREYAQQWSAYPGSANIAKDIQDVLDELATARTWARNRQDCAAQALHVADDLRNRYIGLVGELDSMDEARALIVEQNADLRAALDSAASVNQLLSARLDAAKTYQNAGEIGVIHKVIDGRSWFTLETPEHDLEPTDDDTDAFRRAFTDGAA